MPLFEYGSEWPELDQAPNVQLYPYIALVFFVIGSTLIYIGSKRKSSRSVGYLFNPEVCKS